MTNIWKHTVRPTLNPDADDPNEISIIDMETAFPARDRLDSLVRSNFLEFPNIS